MININFIFTILYLSVLISFSKADSNLFIVDKNAEITVDSIVLNYGDSATFCAYNKIETVVERIAIPVEWHVPSSLDSSPSYYSSCLKIIGKLQLRDTIIVKSEIDSVFIPIIILPGPFLPKFNIKLITPFQKRIVGDTIKAEVLIQNKDGLVPGDICVDSIYYVIPECIQNGSSGILLVDSQKRGFNTYIDQCFYNGRDTIAIIIKSSSLVEDSFSISVSFKDSTYTSEKSILLPVSCKPNRLSNANTSKLITITNGFIRLGKNFEIPMIITITNINGQLIHRGSLIPGKGQSQYPLPSTLMSYECFILTISSQESDIIYSGVVLNKN